jgi:hypothetical protein
MKAAQRTLALAGVLVLAGCTGPSPGPGPSSGPGLVGPPTADPATVQRIVAACTNSGLFKLASGALDVAVPAATLPVAVVNAGVDKVCADPKRFADDVTTVEWVAKNLRPFARS